MRDKYIRN